MEDLLLGPDAETQHSLLHLQQIQGVLLTSPCIGTRVRGSALQVLVGTICGVNALQHGRLLLCGADHPWLFGPGGALVEQPWLLTLGAVPV